jgi:hypothetical protein
VEILLQLYVEPLRRTGTLAAGESEEDVSDMLSSQEINGVFSNIDQVFLFVPIP